MLTLADTTSVGSINPATYFMNCPCHITANNTACNAAEAFRNDTGFDIEDFLIDIYFWSEQSSKRKKNCFKSIVHSVISNIVVKHVSKRWLSLQRAVERVLK